MSKSPKHVIYPDSWRFPSTYRTSLKWQITSRLMMAAVGSVSKIWIEWLNRCKIHNKQTLMKVVESRPEGRGLVTISNHTSCVDDPFLWGKLKMKHVLQHTAMRWTPAAEDVCFTKPLHSWFMTMGQCVPVRRGSGVYQKSMDFLLDKLDMGHWVHIFPEGKVNLTNDKLLRFKWGVGRLVAECKTSPIVLPMFHVGMDHILPNKAPYIPQIRKNVTLLIGNPLDFAKDIELLQSLKKSPREIRKHITDRLQEELRVLQEKAHSVHAEFHR
ncbi:tafazzin-like [Babylonia areolata]|uniref:tafazzin-like n=1 Tax=Babylonia areolata TaxID=304850 RepID=UPI003FD00C9F